jgi:Protein of unknown function (DUF3752)
MPAVGPELPPHLMKRKRSSDSGSDDTGESSSPPRINATSRDKPRRVLGPALPPAPFDERPIEPADKLEEEDSSSDDDGYGPSLPPAPGSAAAKEAEAQAQAREEAAAIQEKSKKPQREEWMLAPPTDSSWSSRVDPTKLKNRKFATGKGAKAPSEKTGISVIWTETPEQKRQRLEDEVMGRKDLSAQSTWKKPRKDDAEAESTARRIREYNEKNRGQSLIEQHKKAVPKEKEDDPSKRAFDKEKDMALGGRIGHVEKKQMLKQAGDFGSRFERGSFL